MDYIKYAGTPEPLKFLNKEKTYIGFVSRVEKDDELEMLLQNETFNKILKELTSKLPLKRIVTLDVLI